MPPPDFLFPGLGKGRGGAKNQTRTPALTRAGGEKREGGALGGKDRRFFCCFFGVKGGKRADAEGGNRGREEEEQTQTQRRRGEGKRREREGEERRLDRAHRRPLFFFAAERTTAPPSVALSLFLSLCCSRRCVSLSPGDLFPSGGGVCPLRRERLHTRCVFCLERGEGGSCLLSLFNGAPAPNRQPKAREQRARKRGVGAARDEQEGRRVLAAPVLCRSRGGRGVVVVVVRPKRRAGGCDARGATRRRAHAQAAFFGGGERFPVVSLSAVQSLTVSHSREGGQIPPPRHTNTHRGGPPEGKEEKRKGGRKKKKQGQGRRRRPAAAARRRRFCCFSIVFVSWAAALLSSFFPPT